MGSFLFFIGVIVIFLLAMRAVNKKSAVLVARIYDCCRHHNCSTNIFPALIVAFGLLNIVFNIVVVTAVGSSMFLLPAMGTGLALMALPILLLLPRHGLRFWKVLMLKFMLIPVALVNFGSNILGGSHQKSKRVKHIGGETEYYYAIQEYIVQDGWQLQFLYSFGNDYYMNADGTVCIVDHRQTLRFEDLVYEIQPLFNVNDPLPKWIRRLY